MIVLTSKKDTIFIVPHTHWDREWYLPFQNFRAKLVKLIDSVIEICEKQVFRFMLDGQTIVLEDYLEIKPEKKERLLKLEKFIIVNVMVLKLINLIMIVLKDTLEVFKPLQEMFKHLNYIQLKNL